MKKLVIFGPGDVGQLAHFYFTRDAGRAVAAFCADASRITESHFMGLPVVPFEEIETSHPSSEFTMFVALSYNQLNQVRAAKYQEAKAKGYTLESYICSRSVVWPDTPIGDNCFILENQTIQPFTKIGNNVTLWSGNHIGHHSVIGDHCFLTSHVVVSGHVEIGAFSFLGVNCTLKDGIRLAPSTVVAAGATLLRNTVENGVYSGNPAELRTKQASRVRYFTHTAYPKMER